MVAPLKPRLVLDTNVILSALLFRSGRVSWLVPLWQRTKIVVLLSKATASELLRVLAYPKFKLEIEEQQCILQAFIPYVETVQTESANTITRCRDPHDEKFLILAEQGNADFLVTGDDDLLSLENVSGCPIVTPAALREILHLGDYDGNY